MTIYVFIGPTITPDEAAEELDAVYLPPVSQGDVYRAALSRPRAIGIIDGYFERVPAVWHKEILWAMTQGIHVFGASSMGALRAAELAPFGMVGVGAIYESYRDGSLENDDEVAVMHGPTESGFVALSEALVDIRRTLVDAVAARVIAPATRETLHQIAAELFYADRTYPEVLCRAAKQGVVATELTALRAWLPRGRVSQKREDAVAMLRTMKSMLASDVREKAVQFWFEHTEWWDRAQRHAGEVVDQGEDADTIVLDALLDELRLDPELYADATQGAFLRHLALTEARRIGTALNGDAVRTATENFRRGNGLFQPEDVEQWIEINHLTHDQFQHLMKDEALLHRMSVCNERHIVPLLSDHLRMTGHYPGLLERARDKQRILELVGLQNAGIADTGLNRDQLLGWYFEERLTCDQPGNVARYSRNAGFADEESLVRTLVREYCYARMAHPPRAG